ncbi:MAG: ABC transporter permease [bacterium]
MRIQDLFLEVVNALSSNKVRSGLTMLGIVIGIASVIAMVSIGQGTQASIQASIQSLGSNMLSVTPGAAQQGRGVVSTGRGASQSLKNEDVDVLRAVNGVAAVSGEHQKRFQITSTIGNNTNSTVIGVTPDYLVVRNASVENGSFFDESELRGMGRVAVIGPTVATDLFGEEDPIGKKIRINKSDFKVIGVLLAKGGSGFFSPDDTILVPLTTMQKILAGADYLTSIAISVSDEKLMAGTREEATAVLAAKHNVDPLSPDFSIASQADMLGALSSIMATLTAFLASIAGISLVVGGIGIMNMMLTTVTERTREIGLRKAIGAKRHDINYQFLAEAIMLTFIGGAVGITFGWGISLAVTQFAGIATQVSMQSVLLAFGVSAFIGILFGYYPARRAAALNPIQALRYE